MKKLFDETSLVGAPRENADADDFHSADEKTGKEETEVNTEAEDEKKSQSLVNRFLFFSNAKLFVRIDF